MVDEENDKVPMAECGACRTVIPLDSTECPECQTKFSGVSDEALGECGACQKLVPLDSTRCPECGVVFVADDVVDILRTWIHNTGINIRKLFEKFDVNGDGTIDADELRTGLLGLNLADLPPSQVDRLVAEIDADGNGVIDLDEFDTILSGDGGAEDADTGVEVDDSDALDEESEEPEDDADAHGDDSEEEVEGEDQEDSTSSVESEEFLSDESDEAPSDEEDGHEEVESESFESSEEEHGEDESDEASTSDDSGEPEEEGETEAIHPLQALADMMDEHEISAQRMFNELDVDGNGLISLSELSTALVEKFGDVLEIENVEALLEDVDTDGDGMIDVTEFIESMESLDDHEEVVKQEKPPKQFPTDWQKRMMSKTWNDNVWPIVHVGMGILITLLLVNALVGPVDGSGGSVVFQEIEDSLPPKELNLIDGKSVYPCDNDYQAGGCKNSLTPLAGENGASSMPKGFYWDGIILLLLSISGLCASLFIHLVKAPAWRARVKAMKELADDKSDAAESKESEEGDDESIGDDAEDTGDAHDEERGDIEDVDDDEEAYDDEEEQEGEEEGEEDDDSIDIGSHIGLMLEDEEVFGTILEFDDDEGTVTIEEDGTGDLVTGYQDDMFLE